MGTAQTSPECEARGCKLLGKEARRWNDSRKIAAFQIIDCTGLRRYVPRLKNIEESGMLKRRELKTKLYDYILPNIVHFGDKNILDKECNMGFLTCSTSQEATDFIDVALEQDQKNDNLTFFDSNESTIKIKLKPSLSIRYYESTIF